MAAPQAKKPAAKASNKSVGRPKQHPAIRFARQFKTYSTGETKNSPTTVPNIIFFLGLFLIVASAIKSGRLARFFDDIWQPASASPGTISSDLLNQLRVVGLQLLALFSSTVIARFIPPVSRPILIVYVGMTILFFINNPQVLQWLNAQEQQASQFQNPASASSSVSTPPTPPRGLNPGPQLTLQQVQQIQSNINKLLAARSGGQL